MTQQKPHEQLRGEELKSYLQSSNPDNNKSGLNSLSVDYVNFPSDGVLYTPKVEGCEVEMLCGQDEIILSSQQLIESGKVIDVLLRRKIKNCPLDPSQLLPGDRSAIMLNLRVTGYGPEYETTVLNPYTNKYMTSVVDLTKLKYKPLGATPDENFHFDFELPMSKSIVKFRLLTVGESKEIKDNLVAQSEINPKIIDEEPLIILTSQIHSIGTDTDKLVIRKKLNNMPMKDLKSLQSYILKISPGVDNNYEFQVGEGASKKTFFRGIRFGADFFYPDLG